MKNYLFPRLVVLIIVVFYGGFSLFNYSPIEEDAFIVFKYAENIVSGYGHVFNRGGDRIEACSTLTWLYLLSLLHALGCSLPTTAKVLGIFLGCTSLLLVFRMTRSFTDEMPWVIFPAMLTVLTVPFLMWNQMGLETALYTVIFLSLISVCLNKSLFIYWPLAALALVTTRPEGFFILLALIPVFYFRRDQERLLAYSLTAFVVALVILESLRFYYFHDFLPTAFYIKVYPTKYLLGFRYLHSFLKDYYFYFLCVPVLFFMGARWNWQEQRSILFGFIVVYLTWVVYAGEEGSKPFYRPLVPLIPVLFIYVITGVGKACEGLNSRKKLLVGSFIAIFAFTTLFFSKNYVLYYYDVGNPITQNVTHFFSSPYSYLKQNYDRIRNPARSGQFLVGKFIQRNYYPGTKMVYDQMGRVPYGAGSEYYFIDSWGLIDKTIGHYHFYERSKDSILLKWYESASSFLIKRVSPEREFLYTRDDVLDYIYEQNPDVILIYGFILTGKDRFPYLLTRDKRFSDNYSLHYYIDGTLFFERQGLSKKPLDIPDGLTVMSAQEYYASRKGRLPF